MSDDFAITTASTSVTLQDRRGEASFSVTNRAGRALNARGQVVPDGAARSSWFRIEGDAVRRFDVGATHAYTVAIAVPTDAVPGSYRFRFDEVGVENPDDIYGRGPTVSFEAASAPVREEPRPDRGYLTALVGALLGALTGTVLAVGAVGGIAVASDPSLSIGEAIVGAFAEAIVWVLAIAVLGSLGYWLGAVLGAGLALRSRELAGPVQTAVIVLVLLPATTLAVLWLVSQIGSPPSGVVGLIVLAIPGAVAIALAVYPARAAVLRWQERRRGRPREVEG